MAAAGAGGMQEDSLEEILHVAVAHRGIEAIGAVDANRGGAGIGGGGDREIVAIQGDIVGRDDQRIRSRRRIRQRLLEAPDPRRGDRLRQGRHGPGAIRIALGRAGAMGQGEQGDQAEQDGWDAHDGYRCGKETNADRNRRPSPSSRHGRAGAGWLATLAHGHVQPFVPNICLMPPWHKGRTIPASSSPGSVLICKNKFMNRNSP